MADMKETLTKKAGPLPVWVWTLGGVGLLAAFLIYKQKKSVASQSQVGDVNAQSTDLATGQLSNLTPVAGPTPFQMGDTFTNVTNNVSQPSTPAQTPQANPYRGAQWAAGQKVVIGGTPGVADPWNVLASKILSSNTVNKEGTNNVSSATSANNIKIAVDALKAANPGLAKKYPTAVPNTQTIKIPYIAGLNWGSNQQFPQKTTVQTVDHWKVGVPQ